MAHFSNLLRDILKSHGLSQRAFAKKAGITQSAVSHYLGDRAPPPLDRIVRWAEVLGLSGHERTAFVGAAHLSHATPETQGLVTSLRGLVAQASEQINAAIQTQQRAWLDGLSDEELKKYPPFLAEWRNDLQHGDPAAKTEALRRLTLIPAPMRFDGSPDFERAFLDPVNPLAKWHKTRADAAEKELAQLRSQLRDLIRAPAVPDDPPPPPSANP